ncbi:site-2 protease family protein [Patescibacteria group bacterium]|nr:site-2 protease family protein [Patescibacteria group bacterium]
METIITFILILGLLILVHELGHFISARRLGVDVEEFAIGFPPKIFSKKKNGVKYSINWIPLGGYVKIKGESGDNTDDPNSFAVQPAWKKLIIVSAGVFMNFLLSFILLSIIFVSGFPQELDGSIPADKITDKRVTVLEIVKNSPADKAGIEIGDKVVSINGEVFDDYNAAHDKIESLRGQTVDIIVEKSNKQTEQYKIEHAQLDGEEASMIGIGIINTGVVNYGFFGGIWQGLKVTGIMIFRIIQALYYLIADLVTKGAVPEGFGGPVAVAMVTGEVIKLGFLRIVYFAAVLSINLGVINFFPFPALDGGRALFISLQAITRRKLNEKVEAWIHNSGFIILVALLVIITVRDFKNYGPMIFNSIKNLF